MEIHVIQVDSHCSATSVCLSEGQSGYCNFFKEYFDLMENFKDKGWSRTQDELIIAGQNGKKGTDFSV